MGSSLAGADGSGGLAAPPSGANVPISHILRARAALAKIFAERGPASESLNP
jgi:hypothetical protein